MANEELISRVYVRELKDALSLKQIAGSDNSLNRWIIAPDINRPGLELSGYTESNDLKRVVVLGTKEYEYMQNFSYEEQRAKYEIITDSFTPCIIISDGFTGSDALLNLANVRDFPVFKYNGKTYQLIVDAVSFLSEKLAITDNLYGVMMNIYGKGIMITGKSGIGKSEVALDLINRGHMLVADDRVDIKRVHNSILCTAPDLLKRMLEIRGLGIVDVTRMFGANTFMNKCQLDLHIKLIRINELEEEDRLNPLNSQTNVMGVMIPTITIPITEGKSLSVIIEAAVSNYLLKKLGFDSNESFKENYRNLLINNSANV